ncbi:hypothetical protein Drorol1_Dr00025141 [Drosera rotundifolia]
MGTMSCKEKARVVKLMMEKSVMATLNLTVEVLVEQRSMSSPSTRNRLPYADGPSIVRHLSIGPVNSKTREAAPRIRTPASIHGCGCENKDKEPWVGPGRLMQREKKKGHGPPLAGWAAGEEKGSNRLSLGPHVLVGPAKKRKGPFKPPWAGQTE